jgi:CHASE3 domain sensor protein
VGDDERQSARMAELREAVKARVRYIDETLSLRVTGGFPPAQALAFSNGPQNATKRVDDIVASMRTEEQRLLSERSRVSEERATHTFLITSMGGVLDAVFLGIVFVILDRRV